MRKLEVKEYLSTADLAKKMKEEKDAQQFKRWQVIYLAKTTDMKALDIASIIKISTASVYNFVEKYNNKGPKELLIKKRGGRRESCAYMTLKEEASLLKSLEEEASKGLIITGKRIKGAVETKLGHQVSIDYAYDIMHRHKWRQKVPRPAHPKKDSEKQEDFKKNFLA